MPDSPAIMFGGGLKKCEEPAEGPHQPLFRYADGFPLTSSDFWSLLSTPNPLPFIGSFKHLKP